MHVASSTIPHIATANMRIEKRHATWPASFGDDYEHTSTLGVPGSAVNSGPPLSPWHESFPPLGTPAHSCVADSVYTDAHDFRATWSMHTTAKKATVSGESVLLLPITTINDANPCLNHLEAPMHPSPDILPLSNPIIHLGAPNVLVKLMKRELGLGKEKEQPQSGQDMPASFAEGCCWDSYM